MSSIDVFRKFPDKIVDRLRKYRLEDTYRSVSWAYACINAIAEACSSVSLNFYKDSPTGNPSTRVPLPKTHPIYKVFNPPKQWEIPSCSELVKRSFINLGNLGEAFLIIEKNGSKPENVTLLQSSRVDPKYAADGVTLIGWKLKSPTGQDTGKVLKIGEIIPLTYYNPYDPYRGLSPLAAGRLAIEQEINMSIWNAGFFLGGVRNPLVIILKRMFASSKQRMQYLDDIRKMYSGFSSGQGPMLVEGGSDVRPLFQSMKDLDFISGKKLTREEICGLFGVPPAQVGIFEYANYANCVVADTKVTLKDGSTVEVVDLQAGDEILTMGEDGIVPSVVNHMWAAGAKEIYKISTGSRTVRCSAEHKFYQLTAGVNPANPRRKEWANAQDLKVGDYIAVVSKLPEAGGHELPDGSEATHGLLHQLGLYLGDGNVASSRGYKTGLTFAIADSDPDKHSYIEEARIVWKSNICRDKYTYRVCSVAAAKQIANLGFSGSSLEKRIPRWVFTTSPELRKSLLQGIFESDGHHDKHGRVQVRLANKELIEDIRALCVSVGYSVNNTCTQERETNFGHQVIHGVVVSFNGGGTREFENHPLPEGLSWERIRSIELQDMEETYDIEVEGTHNFFADHVVVHNSREQRRLFWDNTVSPKLCYFRDMLQVGFVDVYYPGIVCDWDWKYIERKNEDPIAKATNGNLIASASLTLSGQGYDKGQIAIILDKPELDPDYNPPHGDSDNEGTSDDDAEDADEIEESFRFRLVNPPQVKQIGEGKRIETTEKFMGQYAANFSGMLLPGLSINWNHFVSNFAKEVFEAKKKGVELDADHWKRTWERSVSTTVRQIFDVGIARAIEEIDNPNNTLPSFKNVVRANSFELIKSENPQDAIDWFSRQTAPKSKQIFEFFNSLFTSEGPIGLVKAAPEALIMTQTTISDAIWAASRIYHHARFMAHCARGVTQHMWVYSEKCAVKSHASLAGKTVGMWQPFADGGYIYPHSHDKTPGAAPCYCTTYPVEMT